MAKMDKEELINLLKELAAFKKAAFAAGTHCSDYKSFRRWWISHPGKDEKMNFGHLAEIIYMFILGLLWKEVQGFSVSTSWHEDMRGIDLRINGKPIQLKTGYMPVEILAPERKKAERNHARLVNILIMEEGEFTNEFYLLEQLVIPELFEEDEFWNTDFGKSSDIIKKIWRWFTDRWYQDKKGNVNCIPENERGNT